jgi:hypothetical protein
MTSAFDNLSEWQLVEYDVILTHFEPERNWRRRSMTYRYRSCPVA